MEQRIIISQNLRQDIAIAISECEHDGVFLLTDDTTLAACWPVISDSLALRGAHMITIPATDSHKDINSLQHVWSSLQSMGATRHSLLINLGGGMITDLGGFAAATFKRGIDFVNVPTTLLAMVDAAVGGKTGINFGGLKNEIGAFAEARFVIISTEFLRTLNAQNLLSGYAEMLKHGLLSGREMWAELLRFDFGAPDYALLADMVRLSIRVKQDIVRQDPREQGLRKALNLGHTIGHAFEEWSLQDGHKPILHGYAVAFGLVAELYLSCLKTGFPTEKMRQTVSFIRQNYGSLPITCQDYDALITLMHHDKKNEGREINLTLLADIGDVRINQTASEDEIKEALDFFREG